MRTSRSRLIVYLLFAGCAHHAQLQKPSTCCKAPGAAAAGVAHAAYETEQDRKDRQLRAAIQAASLQDVELFLKQGANPNQRDEQDRPLLFAAYDKGGPLLVEALLKGGANADAPDGDGATLLMKVAYEDDLELVNLMLAHGAHPSQQTAGGINALSFAALAGHVDIMRALVNAGANPSTGMINTWPPVALAIYSRKYGAADFMIEQVASSPDAVAQLGMALAMSARIDAVFPAEGILKTPQRDQVLKEHGLTSLWVAICFRAPGVTRDLIEAGVDVQAKLSIGVTLLHVAAAQGFTKGLELLLRAGADPNARGPEGVTPLMLSAQRGCVPSAKLLLAQGADPNLSLSNTRSTPLMKAVEAGRAAMVRLLLASGADAALQNDQGQTALDIARLHSYPEIVQLLAPAQPQT